MCGRGTALFEALRRGYRATGIEIDKTDVQQVEQFLKKYLEYNRYKFSLDHDSLTVPGAAPRPAFARPICKRCGRPEGKTLFSGSGARRYPASQELL